MGLGEDMIVAGLGYRSRISTEEVQRALTHALSQYRISPERLDQIAVAAMKVDDDAILAVASARGVQLVRIEQCDMEAVSPYALTHSVPSMAARNVPSVSETVALAAAGPGARLLGRRIALGPVTCALAEGVAT
jgi:cobalt-precorrin 5A hydrolase